ncbi:MAG: polysaccharide deacetylase family protein [Clostridia bacterium]
MTKKRGLGRNLSQAHAVLTFALLIIIALLYTSFSIFQENKKLEDEMQQISVEYNEDLQNQMNEKEAEILVLQNQITQNIEQNHQLQQVIDAIPPKPDMYDGNSPLHNFLYEDLRVDPVEVGEPAENVVYLTFDDGPSQITIEILDILAENNIKATFFVQGVYLNKTENMEILKRAFDEGHAIGVHTDTHIYTDVYSSVTNFLKDYYAVWDKIYQITGEKTALYRFPGGSVNPYSSSTIDDIKIELENRNFVYFDWNVSGDDSIANPTVESIIQNATKSKGYSRCVVLMHDSGSKSKTLQALPDIIEYYKNEGYSFDKLSADVLPIQF